MKNYFVTILRLCIIVFGCIGLSFLFPNELYKFTYYTNLSNIVVVIFHSYLLLAKQLTNSFIWRLKGCITICITLTFLVYAILLAPKATPEEFYHIKNYTLHYIVPILTLIDWFLIDKKGYYKRFDPLLWTIFPLVYCIFSMIKGYVFHIPIPNEPHSPYPYFFLNINQYGWNGFFIYVLAILIAYMLFGYGMYFIKRQKH